ncbi:MAG: DUF4158 domain-containing protein, partial [Francisellaceae bacterium]|nr:DUF4158 domain-containing protein [Francisellaceae bacterium]
MPEMIEFSSSEVSLANSKIGPTNQYAFLVMLGYFRKHIRFPSKGETLPLYLKQSALNYLNISHHQLFKFDWSARTAKRYRHEIRQLLGFSEPTNQDAMHYIEHLTTTVIPHSPSDESMYEQSKIYFKLHKLESFKPNQLLRYIATAKNQFEQQLFNKIYKSISIQDKALIQEILSTDKESININTIRLADLKQDIPGARLKNVKQGMLQLQSLGRFTWPTDIFNSIDRRTLLKYYDRIMALSPSNIQESNKISLYALMSIFCYIRYQVILDNLVDIFIKLVHRMHTKAEIFVDKNVLRDVKRVGGKFDILERLALATANNPKGVIEDTIYPDIPRDLLLELINDLRQRGKWYQGQVKEKIRSNYVHGNRSILLPLLGLFDLKKDHALYKPVIDAVMFINENWNSTNREYYTKVPPLDGVISKSWKSRVIIDTNDDSKVNKYNYEIAVLEQIKVLIGFKGIWINGSYRFRNPSDDIPKDFD